MNNKQRTMNNEQRTMNDEQRTMLENKPDRRPLAGSSEHEMRNAKEVG
jgi:hypothetical protein